MEDWEGLAREAAGNMERRALRFLRQGKRKAGATKARVTQEGGASSAPTKGGAIVAELWLFGKFEGAEDGLGVAIGAVG